MGMLWVCCGLGPRAAGEPKEDCTALETLAGLVHIHANVAKLRAQTNLQMPSN